MSIASCRSPAGSPPSGSRGLGSTAARGAFRLGWACAGHASRLDRWDAVLPLVPTRSVSRDYPVRSLAVAADGMVVTGGEDHVVRAWKGDQAAWSMGLPSENGDRPPFHQWRSPYPWWDFTREGIRGLLIQRIALRTDGRNWSQTELYAAEDGRRLKSFPESGLGRLLKMSDDRRFAVVVASERGMELDLELFSIEENRAIGHHVVPLRQQPERIPGFRGRPRRLLHRVLDHVAFLPPLPGRHGEAGGVAPPTSRCPGGRTGGGSDLGPLVLAVVRHRRTMALFPTPQVDVGSRLAGRGTATASDPTPFGQVIDLEKATRVSELEGIGPSDDLPSRAPILIAGGRYCVTISMDSITSQLAYRCFRALPARRLGHLHREGDSLGRPSMVLDDDGIRDPSRSGRWQDPGHGPNSR